MVNWLQAAIVAGITLLASFGLHSLDVWRLEQKQTSALKNQQAALIKQCDDDKKITTEVSHEFESQIMSLHQQLDNAKQLRGSQCIIVQPSIGSPRHNAAPRPKPPGQDGITASSLIDYAGEAERYRLQLVSCQRFISDVWKSRVPWRKEAVQP